LHPRDMQRVIAVMKRLRDAGNSLLVVEHDPQIMLEADRIIDMGPGAGERGGLIVFNGTPEQLRHNHASLTADYLTGRRTLPVSSEAPRTAPINMPGEVVAEARANRWLEIRGVRHHNLKGIDVRIPLKRLVCITGVSGSGKSTVVEDVLYPALLKYKGRPSEAPGEFESLRGAELIDDVVLVDQTPIGRTTRSNPASYVGAFDVVRELFSLEPTAVERKYTAGTFSFNSGTGRCPTCSGNGFEHVEMQFLSDVYLRCPDCNGTRYRDEVLEVKREGSDGRRANIAEVLNMTVTEALAFFAESRELATRLKPLADVGLEYVKLGQPVPTLSGGEAQRLKLAGHLADAAAQAVTTSANGKLFLFDEPTTGLHFEDIRKLLTVLSRLVDQGNTVLVIEHNLDVIKTADWVIDLGPEGGRRGGLVVGEGTPETIAELDTATGTVLREALSVGRRGP
jgi:excinuclease ABC subunit A